MTISDITEQERLVEEKRYQEQILIQQSKMAALGEMIESIVHQWKQPINSLSLNIQDLEFEYDYNNGISKEYINKMISKSMKTIGFMSKTIDDFRNFFKVSKTAVVFSTLDIIRELCDMFSGIFLKASIDITLIDNKSDNLNVVGYPTEFKQVILNIINNAKDAIESKRLEVGYFEGKIDIIFSNDSEILTINIIDNAGGIPEDIIDKIFESRFSTKGDNGSGIGLYIAKMIIESMNGDISVKNVERGANFVIKLKL
jgi:signal transduction histidine kinase